MQVVDAFVDNREFNVEGISGSVSRYLKEKVSYPFFLLESTADSPVQLNKLKVLANLFGTSTVTNSDLSPVSVYYKDGDKVVKLGKLSARQVKSFLRLFTDNKVVGMYDKDTELKGDYLYVLSE